MSRLSPRTDLVGARPARATAAVRRGVGVALLLAACSLALGYPGRSAFAASMADLRAEAKSIGLVPGSGGAGEQAALDRMGKVALAFLDAADAGEAGAVATYEAIAEPLERSYHAHRNALDALSKGVIDADGDLDALYESPAWKEHQQLAAQALYYLNWLHYRGALFYEGKKRQSLLEEAASGFGEFATANRDSPVVAESHLGRGLAYLELDKNDWAITDFEAAAESKGASPERARKARLRVASSGASSAVSRMPFSANSPSMRGGAASSNSAASSRAKAMTEASASRLTRISPAPAPLAIERLAVTAPRLSF